MVPIDQIMQYENGEMNQEEMIFMFGELVKDGMAWKLQGHYGRTAHALINYGFLDTNGNVLKTEED